MEACDQIGVGKLPIEASINHGESPLEGSSGEPEVNVDYAELKDMGQQQQKMSINNLQSLRAHAYEILSVLENGVLVEPWMDEKIAIASDYIVTVANAIMYRK